LSKLKASAKWTQAERQRLQLIQQKWEKRKALVLWLVQRIWMGKTGIAFYIVSAFIFIMMGGIWLINSPESIVCPDRKSLCFLLRWDKSSVILPEQRVELLQKLEEYFAHKKQHPHK
jgi:hypothetical protein